MNRILIVEDEITISRLIAVSLRRAGYDCTVANDGSTAADLIAEHDFDLALLDIMLPGLDGYELLGYLRPLGVPVIFITAKGATKDRVRGLQLGADDYIVKPFEIEELLARVEAVLRRTGRGGQTLTAFDVTMDIVARTVTRQGKAVELTPREFDLLEQLMRNRGAALYRDVLYGRVWGGDLLDSRTLDLHIQRLRKNLAGRIRSKPSTVSVTALNPTRNNLKLLISHFQFQTYLRVFYEIFSKTCLHHAAGHRRVFCRGRCGTGQRQLYGPPERSRRAGTKHARHAVRRGGGLLPGPDRPRRRYLRG